MNDLNTWAPYLNNPLTLAAFVVLVVAMVFLTMLTARVGIRLQSFVALVFVVVSLGTLSLAVLSASTSPAENSKVASDEPTSIRSNTIQTVQGSNNVLINQSEKSK